MKRGEMEYNYARVMLRRRWGKDRDGWGPDLESDITLLKKLEGISEKEFQEMANEYLAGGCGIAG